MANEQNLKPFGSDKLTVTEQRELQRAGGIASGKARSARAREKEEWARLLSMAMGNGEAEDIQSLADAKKANLSISTAMKVKLITEALKGNLKAYEIIQRYAGAEEPEAPEASQEQSGNSFIDALNRTASEVWASEAENAKKE